MTMKALLMTFEKLIDYQNSCQSTLCQQPKSMIHSFHDRSIKMSESCILGIFQLGFKFCSWTENGCQSR